MKKIILPLALFAICTAGPGFATETNSALLKTSVLVSGPTVSLADLITGTDLPSDGLFVAPLPGQTGTIRANRVVEAAQKLGVKQIIGDTTGSITITRQGRRIASSEVDASLKQAIIAKGEIDQPDYTFINGASVPDLYVEEGLAGAPVITDLKIDRETLRFSASVTVPGSASLAKMPLKLEGQITEMVDVPMAAHALGKNDIITAGDIRIEKRDRKAIAGIMPVRPSTLKGQAARTSIATGSIITEDLVMKPILVEKAMAVSVTYATGGLHLTLRGKANESGALGDMISVLNPQSKKSLFATVTGPGTVAILSDVPAPIASRQAANTVQ
jgi:flagella basal body P-ring formation protein FlgA